MADVTSAIPNREPVKYEPNAIHEPKDVFEEMGTSEFLNLMVTELQNQDPLDPADTNQLLTQMGQIREIAASDKLTDSLDLLLVGENMSTAASMIGNNISGMTAMGDEIEGVVDYVSFDDDKNIQMYVGDYNIPLDNVREIRPMVDESSDAQQKNQKMSIASSLIGKQISGIADDESVVIGPVERVAVEGNSIFVTVNDKYVPLQNVVTIEAASDESDADDATETDSSSGDAA